MDDIHDIRQDWAITRQDTTADNSGLTATSVLRVAKPRSSSVELTPITDEDVPAVADFLHANLNDRVPWAQSCAAAPRQAAAPNHGFMLRDGECIVGALLALYSQRVVAGRPERFCNMGSWCVLPDYRPRSILLLKALLAQDGYNFTVLTPNLGSQEILAWYGFRFLDTAGALIPNLPWPVLPGQTKISADPDVIDQALTGPQLEFYRDHRRAMAAQHLALIRGDDSCYVIWRQARYGKKSVAHILHVSNPALFHRSLLPLTRHLLVRHRLMATLVELRIVERKPHLSAKFSVWPKMYRSADLAPKQIDYLYSELLCVPW